MNPNQPGVSFGTGGNLLGANAGQLLGMPGGLQQQSPASAGYQPGTLPPTQGMRPPQSPTMAPMPGAMPPANQLPGFPGQANGGVFPGQANGGVFPGGGPQRGVVGTPPGVPETQMILKALIARQQLLGEHEEAVRNAMLPPQPQGV